MLNTCHYCGMFVRPDGPIAYGDEYGLPGKLMHPRCLIWIINNRIIPTGMKINMTCNEEWCVNPNHMELIAI